MEEKILRTPRGDVHYWISRHPDRDAKPIFFLHGLTADHTLFDKQTGYFSDKYHVLSWDAPCHGRSRPYREFTYPNAALDLLAILEKEGFRRCILVGQSMGGFIIQSFLKRYPEMAEAFVGIDTCPFGASYYSASDAWWLRQVEWMARCYPHKLLVKAVAKSCTYTRYAYENMLAALSPYGKRELCRLMGIGFTGVLEDNSDLKITCPVLILVGEHDRTGKTKYYSDAWHKATGFPLYVIPNAAHNSNVDNYALVNRLIKEWCGAGWGKVEGTEV